MLEAVEASMYGQLKHEELGQLHALIALIDLRVDRGPTDCQVQTVKSYAEMLPGSCYLT